MYKQKQSFVKVQVRGNSYKVIGGKFNDMLAVVKSVEGRRFDGKSKSWTIPDDQYDSLIKGLKDGMELVADGVTQSEFFPDSEQADTYELSTSSPSDNQSSIQIKNIYTEDELMTMFNISEMGLPELGISSEVLISTVASTLLYFNNKGVSRKENGEEINGLYPHEALILSIDALRMGVNTSSFSCWEKKDGKIEYHLSYKVAQTWIQKCIPQAIVKTFLVEPDSNEYARYTSNRYSVDGVHDIVYKACVLTQKEAKEARLLANEIRRDFREMRKELSVPISPADYEKEWDKANNMAFEQCATVVGVGILEVSDVYACQWDSYKDKKGYTKWVVKKDKSGNILLKTDDDGNLKRKKPNPNGRGDNFIAEKRAMSAAAYMLGEVNLNGYKSEHSFNPDVTKFLVQNPEYDALPDDNLSKKTALQSVIETSEVEYEHLPV
jgi:hypothetical protein